jgi:recombination protein RecR
MAKRVSRGPTPTGYPPHLVRVAQLLQKFPGVGEKAAQRHALHLVTCEEDVAGQLAPLLATLRDTIRRCTRCYGLAERHDDAPPVCGICADTRRAPGLLCIVAHVRDQIAIEASGEMRGHYFVLGKLLSPLEGISAEELAMGALLARVKAHASDLPDPAGMEVLLALPASVNGDATALYLAREIGQLGVTVTRIAKGMPSGAEVEYADALTLRVAIAGRQRA